MAHSSRTVYIRSYKLLQQGMQLMEPKFDLCKDIPISQNKMLFFISFLSLKGLAAATITTYVSPTIFSVQGKQSFLFKHLVQYIVCIYIFMELK